jgi:hypothetical protein
MRHSVSEITPHEITRDDRKLLGVCLASLYAAASARGLATVYTN